jgi:hypothetical protein
VGQLAKLRPIVNRPTAHPPRQLAVPNRLSRKVYPRLSAFIRGPYLF